MERLILDERLQEVDAEPEEVTNYLEYSHDPIARYIMRQTVIHTKSLGSVYIRST